MFMRVNSKCAHQVRPPLGQSEGLDVCSLAGLRRVFSHRAFRAFELRSQGAADSFLFSGQGVKVNRVGSPIACSLMSAKMKPGKSSRASRLSKNF